MLVKFIFNFIHVCQAQCQKTSEQDTVDPHTAGRAGASFRYIYSIKNINTKSDSKQTNTTWANAKRKNEAESKTYREHKAKAGRRSKLGGKTGASLLREGRQSDTGETH